MLASGHHGMNFDLNFQAIRRNFHSLTKICFSYFDAAYHP